MRQPVVAFLAVLISLNFLASSGGAQQEAADPPLSASPRQLPGLQPGGEILLPTQWSLRPAGKQIKVGDFPTHLVLHPSEPWAAVLHAGYGDHEIYILDLTKEEIVSRVTLPQVFYGLCFSPDGKQLYCSGGDLEVVHRFTFAGGYLSEHEEIRIADVTEKFVPAGVTCSANGRELYVACGWGDTLCVVPLENLRGVRHIPLPAESFPYAILPSPDSRQVYVSLWGGSAVAVVDLGADRVVGLWPTRSHPTEMDLSPDGRTLYVACADSNTVCVLDRGTGQTLEVIQTALYPNAPHGSTPNSLDVSADGRVLLVANADNNNVAVIDVSDRGRSRSLGYVPVGWYPTSVRYSSRNGGMLVANGKGLISRANRQGPNPTDRAPESVREYIAGLFRGTVSVIDSPTPQEMARYTREAYACSPLLEDLQPVRAPRSPDNPIPARVGDPSPIKYCIYIIKENRTYDQILGDMPEGNGDPALCLFPERVTPNHHALAREFVLLDNFYVEGEVSADGHEWSMAAYATDFTEKTWPLLYRGSREGKLRYPAEGETFIARPSSGYIWDRCREANVSYFSLGEFVANGEQPGEAGRATVQALEGHFDPHYRSYDLDYPDVKRAERFRELLAAWEAAGEMPRLLIMRLPNDHTHGTSVGKLTPTAMVGDNDLAFGMVIESITHSKFWKETAVVVVEDDAQNGPDHVDAHRTFACVISPFVRRRTVDSTMYSTSSMLRTIELVLGLEPMTQFDAAATPMYASFQAEVDLTPYACRPVTVDLQERNPPEAWGTEISSRLDFSREDVADDLLLNEVIWRSVRGADSPMPPPVRASFVFTAPEREPGED